MTYAMLDIQWIEQIARGTLDTSSLSLAAVETLVRHNLALAVAAAISDDSALTLAEQRLVAHRKRRLMDMMAIVVESIRVSELLTEHGIRHLILKGPALANQTTGSWEGRSSCDVDVLIDPSDYRVVHGIFVNSGLSRQGARRGPAGRLFQWASCEVGYHARLANIDLHWRLDPSPAIYNAPLDQLFERAEIVEIEGKLISTLGRLDAWLLTAVHGARSDWAQWSMLLDAFRQVAHLSVAERLQAKELAGKVGCAVPLAVAEALIARCQPTLIDIPSEAWAIKRADRIIADTCEGRGPSVSLRAAFSRRFEIARAVPGFSGFVGSLGRAAARVILNPDHYKQHFQDSLNLR